MINIKAPAKINLHLEVLGKRRDGYHELAMVMQSIDLADYLEIERNDSGVVKLFCNNKDLDTGEDNIIVRAANLLKNNFKDRLLGADIFLKKNIPIGAGLAGGSTDAAATLVGLNNLWNLNLNSSELHTFGGILGSDVPFCINGGSQYCFGRGEILEPFISKSDYAIILVKNPEVSLSTPRIYKKYSSAFNICDDSFISQIKYKRELLRNNGFESNDFLSNGIKIRNDLQKIAETECSSVKNALSILSEFNNNLCYSMSGSGPSCYAIFENLDLAKTSYDENYNILKEDNFEGWVCSFLNKGVSII